MNRVMDGSSHIISNVSGFVVYNRNLHLFRVKRDWRVSSHRPAFVPSVMLVMGDTAMSSASCLAVSGSIIVFGVSRLDVTSIGVIDVLRAIGII